MNTVPLKTEGLLKATQHTFPESWLTSDRSLRVVVAQTPSMHAVESLFSHTEDDGGEGIGFKPPLGVLYVATYLKKFSRHHVSALDAQVERWDVEELVEAILAQDPDVVGLTAWTDFWYGTYKTAELLKQKKPDLHIVIGGPHVAIYPQETLSHSAADSVVMGDGEVPFLLICNALANGLKPRNIPGVHFKEHGVREGEDPWYIQQDQDHLPFPDRHLLPLKQYTSVLGQGNYITTMITSRGCPYRCTYCKLNFQKTLQRSARNVVDEFEEIQKLGISEVEVYDDTFTWQAARVQEICRGILERGIRVQWAIRDRVNGVREENLELLRKAGCNRIHLGIESASEKTLKTIKKNIQIPQIEKAVGLAKKYGFTTLNYFMIGLPGETREDVHQTIEYALKLDADFTEFNICIPYAGTELYKTALETGQIKHDYWREYAIQPVPHFLVPQLIEDHLSKKELIELRDMAIRRYYFRPKFILREIGSLTTLNEFKRKSRMGLSLFRQSVLPLLYPAASAR